MPEPSTGPRRAQRRVGPARPRPQGRRAPHRLVAAVATVPLLLGPVAAASATDPTPDPRRSGSAAAAAQVRTADAPLSGRVTAAGAPVASAWVTITPVDASGDPAGPPTSAFTDSAGRYEFGEVAPGRVVLLVRSPPSSRFADVWFPGVPTLAQATPLAIATRPLRADVDLPVAGSVSGRLVDAATGAPVAGRVRAVLADAPGSGDVGTAESPGAPGAFTISGLPPQEVQLRVLLPADSAWLVPAPGGATGIVVDGTRDTTGVRIPLEQGAEIRGTVRDDRGLPVARASVGLVGCGAGCPVPVATDAAGSYRIRGIRPGSRVGVVAELPGDQVQRWFPDADDASGATRILVRGGEVVGSVDLTLPRAAFVTVEVSGTRSDQPLRAVARLTGTDRTYNQYFAHSPGGAGAGGAGAGTPVRLRVGPIPAGEYSILVTPGLPDPGHLPRRWISSATLDGPGTTRVAPGQEAFAVAEYQGPGAVGRETDDGPRPTSPVPAAPEPTARLASPPTDPPALSPPPGGSWPGLDRGFLDPGATPWPAPAGSTASAGTDDLALDTP